MRGAVGWTGKALLVVLLCVAYQFLVYSVVVDGHAGPVHLVLVLLPLLALAVGMVLHSRNKPFCLAVFAAAGAAIYLLYHQDGLGVATISGLPHAAAYSFLLWYFGRTLLRGREPIITRFSSSVHGPLPPTMERYTRKVTIAWCIFFAAQLIVSALLFAFASVEAWSLFINLLNLPLLAVMFVGPLAYRTLRYPEFPRTSIGQAIRAFTKDASVSKSPEVR
jgi:uncharacterized membrane protein